MAECIHGLEVPRCDLCYPKAVPASPPRSKPVARSTTAPRSRADLAQRAPARTARAVRKSLNVGEQRVFHVTHLRNLEAILTAGELRADAAPVVDVSTALTRELRASTELWPGLVSAAAAGRTAADHVSFALSPDSGPWRDLRSGAADETRWSLAARRTTPADFVVLVTTIAALGDGVVVTDGDAAARFTRFSTGHSVQELVERAQIDEELRSVVEVLAPAAVPFARIQLIGVANDPARGRVREIVRAGISGAAPKVAVYPPWFASGDAL